jgi:hypothetical protein
MNKIQYISYFKIKGIDEMPKGESIGSMMEKIGKPTVDEMVKVNQMTFEWYIEESNKWQDLNVKICDENESMKKDVEFLRCLESAGVDNWEGYDIAKDMMS